MGVAVTFDRLDQLTVTAAINVAIEAQRQGQPHPQPFALAAIFGCPRCAGLAVEYMDGTVVTCRICHGRGAISMTFEAVTPPPSNYFDRRALIRRHLERLKEPTP